MKAPLRKGSEFLSVARERLTYRIIMFGIPVGEAILEAANNAGTFVITIRVASNAAISMLYPVDDLVETRLVCGNYLVTRINQHEGNYSRNSGFTLMLRERRAFSVDRLGADLKQTHYPGTMYSTQYRGFISCGTNRLKWGNQCCSTCMTGTHMPRRWLKCCEVSGYTFLVWERWRRWWFILCSRQKVYFGKPEKSSSGLPLMHTRFLCGCRRHSSGDVTAELVLAEVEK